mgnify:CR=1 FL=1|tara:strand:+ start:189 stop:416 length:228 start_codon:yes stop_codon:yes gene_type:complete
MIQQPIEVRDEFLYDVKTFCLKNNIEWGTVYSECWLDGAIGTPEQVMKVVNYVNELEKKRDEFRAKKSFWWRLWN